MAKTTAVSLKRWCVHQNALRNLFKRAFTCQRPQLYTNQVSRRSMQRRPRLSRDKNAERQTNRQTDVHSRARDHNSTQTKSHVDTCRDGRDYPVTKCRRTDRQTDIISALYSRYKYIFIM